MAVLATGPLSEHDDSKIFVAPFFCLGAFGASREGDGEAFISMSQQNLMDQSVEATEDDFPILVLRKEIVADTAGAGRFRGGASILWDRVLLRQAEVRPLIMHQGFAPWGAGGGAEGTSGGGWYIAGDTPLAWVRDHPIPTRDGHSPPDFYQRHSRPLTGFYDIKTKAPRAIGAGGSWNLDNRRFQAAPGSVVRVITPSGGGWGQPFERDPAAVLKDVRDGYVSVAGATKTYGVAIDGDPERDPEQLRVDEAATAALRQKGAR